MRFGVRGFTLLELMIVVAIIGIVAALSVDAMTRMAAASGPQNALNEFTAQLASARQRALERQTNVWVIVYPQFSTRTHAATGGPGAYFVYEDRQLQFGRPGCTLPVCYATFDPTGSAPTMGSRGGTGDRLLDAVYFDDVSGKKTRVLPDTDVASVVMPAPFTGLTPRGCSFCSGATLRGALVFRPDGSVRFVGGDGTPVTPTTTGATARIATLSVGEESLVRRYVVSIAGSTGFIGVHAP